MLTIDQIITKNKILKICQKKFGLIKKLNPVFKSWLKMQKRLNHYNIITINGIDKNSLQII